MFSSWGRSVAVLALAAIVVGGTVYAMWPRPEPVDLASVLRAPLEVTINEEGVTRIRDVYVVSAPVPGRFSRTPREVGDRVVADETLVAVIRPTLPTFLDQRGRREAEARVRAAEAAVKLGEAEVRQAKAEWEFASGDLARAERLAKTSTISQRALDQARLDVEVRAAVHAKASADLAVRRQELESARARLIEPGDEAAGRDDTNCCIDIRAPIDGEVMRIVTESEQIIPAGTPLLEIGDPDNLELTVDLLSTDAVQVRPGALAMIERWGGEAMLRARVRRIDSAGFTRVSALGIEEQRVRVTLDPVGDEEIWSQLGHDYRIYARIVVWQGDDVLQVPLSALFRHGDDWAVFRVAGGRARRAGVTLGQRNDRVAEVTGGLEAGEEVIVHPSDVVDDGVAVVARAP